MVVVVAVTMTPGPVFFLFPRRQFAEVAMFVAVIFVSPILVVGYLVVIPDVIIAVIGIIDPIVVVAAACGDKHGRGQSERQ
jgi:hypothetical protein